MSLAWLFIGLAALCALVLIGWSVSRMVNRRHNAGSLPDERALREMFDEHQITGEELRDRTADLLEAREGPPRLVP